MGFEVWCESSFINIYFTVQVLGIVCIRIGRELFLVKYYVNILILCKF